MVPWHRIGATLVLLLGLLASGVAAQDGLPTVALERQIYRAFQNGDHRQALELIEQFLQRSPDHIDMLYNAACAHSLMGDPDEAAAYLLRAVKAGFVDFDLMQRDPDLEGVREHDTYQAIVEAAARVQAEHAGNALRSWRRTYGEDEYRYELDESRKLAFATALDEQSHRQMRRMLERQADQMIATLFEEPPAYEVLIAVPTPAHGRQLFGDDDQVGGIYEHSRRRLIARDIGVSLRHEFFHAMHFGHMSRLGQRHPIWIQEGLAALYEEYEFGDDGEIVFLPNQRHNIVRRRARSGLLVKWPDLFELPQDRFMQKASHLYPQVRSMFEYLADRDLLARWYGIYVEHFDEDASGALAFREALGRPLAEIERDWRKWVAGRPPVDVDIAYGDAALGIETSPRGSNDGVLVSGVLPGSAASRARIRRGDIIVAIDSRPTRSLLELRSVIATKTVGDQVDVRLRRDGQYLEATLVLQPLPPRRVVR